MRLRIEDITQEPVTDVLWLGDYLIRYRVSGDRSTVYYANGRRRIAASSHEDGTVTLREYRAGLWPDQDEEPFRVAGQEQAKRAACDRLSRDPVMRWQVRNRDLRAELTLRHAGELEGARGYPREVYIASTLGRQWRLEICSGIRELEPCRVWYEFQPLSYSVDCCATCDHFAMSGMTRDESGGRLGYCLAQAQPSPQTLVTVSHICPDYTLIPRVPRHLGGPPRP